MTEEQVKRVYQAATARRRDDCPEPEALQALARREGEETARLATLDHVMSCGGCRADLDLLRSVEEAGTATGAATGAGAGRRGSGRTWLVPAALAATVLLAVGLGRLATGPGTDPVRSGDESGVAVVGPGTEANVGEPLTFTWHPVAGALRYRVEVLNLGGELAIEAESRDTMVTIDGIRRLPADDYRWWVVAMMPRPGPRSALRPLRLSAK